MKKFFRKVLIYAILGVIALPVSVFSGITSASKVEAAAELPGAIAAEDFGVVDYDTGITGQLRGYTAGFGLTDATFDSAQSIVVSLYASGDQLLQTNTATSKVGTLTDATAISSPFDVSGSFDYVTDGYWVNVRATEYGQNIPATKVVATVTLANGKIVTAANTTLTGDDPTTIYPDGAIAAEDFGVMNQSDVIGYTAGFGLTAATFDTAKSIVVSLYADDDQLLQTNTATLKVGSLTDATAISSPFDVFGTFDYATDGYWSNVRATEYGQNIPATKVVATVTLANGKIVTATNENPTGGDLTTFGGILAAEDFGVVDYDTGITGQLRGYTAGFGLTDADFAGATSVVMKLYSGETLLQTNTLIGAVSGIQISSPFDVSGSFDYVTDGYWVNVRATEYGQNIPATKVVATVVLANGKIVTAENTALTGDPTTIYPPDITATAPVVTATISGKTVYLSWTEKDTDIDHYEIYVGATGETLTWRGNTTSKSYPPFSFADYGTYNIQVVAVDSHGNRSPILDTVNKIVAVLKNPVVATVVSVVKQASVVEQTATVSSIAPAPAKAVEPQAEEIKVPSDDSGIIKGEESTSENEKTNWTPWIILFILIVLAGAATGGYFYWFAGRDEAEEESGKPVQKGDAPKVVVRDKGKTVERNKTKRW